MAQIVVDQLCKTFRVAKRRSGLWGATVGLVRPDYRHVEALTGVSFTIQEGELVGYIGPNGAGKSTTVKTLAGILVPSSGNVQIDGLVPWRDRVAHVGRIGVVFGQRTQLWYDLPVIESFELLRDIYRVPHEQYRTTRDELIAMLQIEPILGTPVRQLSLGQRMRADIAAALLHRPRIVFLDEPTIGLDAVSKLAVRDFVLRLNREHKVTVILTTHDMDDIETLCRRVMVINNGRLISDGTLHDLRRSISGERWLTVDLKDADARVEQGLGRLIRQEGTRAVLAFDPAVISTADLISKICSQHNVSDLFVENPPIENIIAQIYAGHLAGQVVQ